MLDMSLMAAMSGIIVVSMGLLGYCSTAIVKYIKESLHRQESAPGGNPLH